jgi:hypothetical protein
MQSLHDSLLERECYWTCWFQAVGFLRSINTWNHFETKRWSYRYVNCKAGSITPTLSCCCLASSIFEWTEIRLSWLVSGCDFDDNYSFIFQMWHRDSIGIMPCKSSLLCNLFLRISGRRISHASLIIISDCLTHVIKYVCSPLSETLNLFFKTGLPAWIQ